MQGFSIGGMAEQDIASFIAPAFISKELRRGNTAAKERISTGYDKAGNYLTDAYNAGRGDIGTGTSQAVDALNRGYKQGISTQDPYNKTGQQGLRSLSDMATTGFQFGANDFQTDPGYQFRLQEGQNAIEGSAAARGSLLSGGTLKALQQYGQNFASNEYNNAYNRAQQAYQMRQNAAGNLAGIGQNAANLQSNLYANQGQNVGNMYYNQGNTLAQLGQGYGMNMGSLETTRANNLANLDLQRGNINAGEWKAYLDAAMQQGQHFQDIGSGQLNNQQNVYGGNGGSSGGGGSNMSGMGNFMSMFGGGSSGGMSSGGDMQFGNDFGGSASSGGSASA